MTMGRTVRTASPPVNGRLAQPVPADLDWLPRMREFCELLWPPPAVITLDGSGPGIHLAGAVRPREQARPRPGSSTFVLIPGIRRPPLLVPATNRAAAAAVRHYSGQRSRAARLTTKALSFCLARGLGGAVLRGRLHVGAPPGTDTIETYLGALIPEDILLSMYLGPARANRKPVLQLLTVAGEPVAFAKIGVTPLTRELVRAERASLACLNKVGLAEITVPQVLHHDQWQGLDVLVLSALPSWVGRRPLRAAKLTAAMNEVAGVCSQRREPLLGSEYLQRLRGRLKTADEGPERTALQQALDDIAARAGGTTLTYGAWHGDWAPWNMANTDRGLLVWDWERFACGVPLGFDALHYRLQSQVAPGHRNDPLAVASACVEGAAPLVAPFGVSGEEARLTAILYLTELATRYLADRQAQAGARLGAPGTWLIPAIAAEVGRL
jgi:Phosphotransferase enzyme family